MTDDRAKTPRTLLIADHLWETFASMASDMGGEREALINQALYTFARLNGFLVASDARRIAAAAGSSDGRGAPRQPTQPPVMSVHATMPATLHGAPGPEERFAASRPSANAERVAELERQLATSTPAPSRPSAPPPLAARSESSRSDSPARSDSPVEVDDSLLGDDAPQATSMDLPSLESLNLGNLGKGSRNSIPPVQPKEPPEPPEPPELTPAPGDPTGGSKTLVLLAEGRELDRIIKDRFLIGRGKHCDLIINSGKVSREHAAITREGAEYFIEDLGSSNGTWHDKRRISRRQIQEGDEFFICAEKLSCTFRG